MNKFLEEIRVSKAKSKALRRIVNTGLILIFGISMGIISKWLDMLSINNEIWWQHIIGALDLRNVFSLIGVWLVMALCIAVYSETPIRAGINVFLFFGGMNIAYHVYTIQFAKFNPVNYMMIWYGITLLSPILAFICWYAKGEGKISIFISSIVIAVMLLCSFNIGMGYFDFKSILDTIFFCITVMVLHVSVRKSAYSISVGIIIVYLFRVLL